jgi:UPF0271 protein
MVRRIDLNADVGEECGDDSALLAVVTSANVATGAHAGGGVVLDETVRVAALHGCAVGAHPSYRDREGFGRTSMRGRIDESDLRSDLVDQILLVAGACQAHGVTMRHVKAHGALYNDAMSDAVIARAIVLAVVDADARTGSHGLALVGPPGSVLEAEAASRHVVFIREGFVDRAYTSSGELVPRTLPGAVLVDDVRITAQASALAQGLPIEAIDGRTLALHVDSLCLHGDTPDAVGHARRVRSMLEELGIRLSPPGSLP